MLQLINIIVFATTWSLTSGSIISLWEQTCKVHADNKHDEVNGLLQQQQYFNTNSWTHWGLLLVLILLGVFALVGCSYIFCRCIPLMRLAQRISNDRQNIYTYTGQQQKSHPPYTAHYNHSRQLNLKEIPPPLGNRNKNTTVEVNEE